METLERKAKKAAWHLKNKELSRERARNWAKENKVRHTQLKRAWSKRNVEKVSLSHRLAQWKRKGIKNASIELYDRYSKDQGGVCAICLNPPTDRRLALDHDHSTGLVRGLLCERCNVALGGFEFIKNNAERFARTLEYLVPKHGI